MGCRSRRACFLLTYSRQPDSGTPLHHAVCSGSLATVQALIEAGADPDRRDTAWGGTPLGWAEYYLAERKDQDSQRRYGAIADYLRARCPH